MNFRLAIEWIRNVGLLTSCQLCCEYEIRRTRTSVVGAVAVSDKVTVVRCHY